MVAIEEASAVAAAAAASASPGEEPFLTEFAPSEFTLKNAEFKFKDSSAVMMESIGTRLHNDLYVYIYISFTYIFIYIYIYHLHT